MRTAGASGVETKARVLDASVRVFAQRGFAAAGVRELASEAGITSAALYHYMKRKEDLLVDIMRSTLVPLLEASEVALVEHPKPAEQLAILMELHVWMHGAKAQAALVSDTELRALTGADHEMIVELRDRYENVWRDVIRAGREEKTFDVSDVAVTTIALLQVCNGVSNWFVAGGRLTLLEVCEMHADLALGMVGAVNGRRRIRRAAMDLPHPGELLEMVETAALSA